MADELIDIVDDENVLTGIKKMKSEAHKLGLFHRSAHVWVYNDRGEILIQLRSKSSVLYPDAWDISAAGHVSTGEEPIVAAIRETEEEIGIAFSETDLKFVEIREVEHLFNGLINREFCYIYLVKYSGQEIVLQKEEVQEFKFISPEELLSSINAEPDKFVPHGNYWVETLDRIKHQ